MRKITLALIVLSFVFLAACSTESTRTPQSSAVPAVTSDTSVDEMIAEENNGELKEFKMTAKQWEFNPSSITVNQGDNVMIEITSVDVEHGFAIREFGINADLMPGKTEIVEFIADKKGIFEFSCSVFCGEGHKHMTGTLIVE